MKDALTQRKGTKQCSFAEALYTELKAQGVDVLLDDRDERCGVKFADLELVGISPSLLLSQRKISTKQVR